MGQPLKDPDPDFVLLSKKRKPSNICGHFKKIRSI